MALLDYQDSRPIYEQIVDYYQKLILTGVLEKDEQIPSIRQVAAELSINPNTIQKAFAILEREGYIYTTKGRGHYVADSRGLASQRRKDWLLSLEGQLREGRSLGVEESEVLDRVMFVYKELEAAGKERVSND